MTVPASGLRPFARSIDQIVGGLAARIPELAAELLPNGRREGAEWAVPAASSPFGCSASVHLYGERAGVWSAWAAGKKGDALDLITEVVCGSDKAAAVRWAIAWLGLDGGDPRRLRTTERAVAARQQAPAAPDAQAKRQAAFGLWLAATPLKAGDEAYDYLAHTRGIELARLDRIPGALRFFSALSEPSSGRKWPALLAAVVDGRGQFLTCHRTWLERQADGSVRKAPIECPKKVYGPYKGGTIRLARGASGKAWREAPAGDVLGLAEGLEDALTYAVAMPEHRVAAAISVGNLPNLALPPAIAMVIIAADNDPPGSPAAQTLMRAVARFQREGREVRIARCPAPYKDLNEVLLASREAAR